MRVEPVITVEASYGKAIGIVTMKIPVSEAKRIVNEPYGPNAYGPAIRKAISRRLYMLAKMGIRV